VVQFSAQCNTPVPARKGNFSLDFKTGGSGERRKPKPADCAVIVNYRDPFTFMVARQAGFAALSPTFSKP
jgi:hypothetical protein